jgi:DNA-binding CsgD family transcriptional regulator
VIGVTVDEGGGSLPVRELQVLQCLAEGLSYAEIGVRLHLAAPSVSSAAVRLYRRLGVSSAQHAVHVGYQRGVLVAPCSGCGRGAG